MKRLITDQLGRRIITKDSQSAQWYWVVQGYGIWVVPRLCWCSQVLIFSFSLWKRGPVRTQFHIECILIENRKIVNRRNLDGQVEQRLTPQGTDVSTCNLPKAQENAFTNSRKESLWPLIGRE